jgi:hypothetical protein
MDLNDKAVENVTQWLSQIGGVTPGVYGRVIKIAAFVLFVYVKLPIYQRTVVDQAAISAMCLVNGIPITPSEAQQALLFLQKKRALGPDNRVPFNVKHAIASMA